MGWVPLHRVLIAATLPGLLITLVVAAADAQDLEGRRSGDQSGLGLGVMFAQPVGEFGYYVDESMGLGAFLHLDVGDNGALGLRFDGSMVYYGSQTRPQSFAAGAGYIDYADVTIRNRIGSLFAGPQITFGSGDVRPYVHVGAGFSYFWTGSDWDDSYDDYACEEWEDHEDCEYGFFDVMGDLDMFFEGETEQSHWTAAWTAGGGVSVRLGGVINLYFALQYVNHGRVRYLTEGAIVDHGDGYYSFTPVESDANLLFAQFGIAIQ
jgi:opacity protein-like surface antigen